MVAPWKLAGLCLIIAAVIVVAILFIGPVVPYQSSPVAPGPLE
jgi:hypothetical protein